MSRVILKTHSGVRRPGIFSVLVARCTSASSGNTHSYVLNGNCCSVCFRICGNQTHCGFGKHPALGRLNPYHNVARLLCVVHDTIDSMDAFGIELDGIHTETGPGVYEAAIRYSDGIAAADKGALFKNGIKELAPRHDLVATFMAKWNADLPGCSGHIHQSLIDSSGHNLFASDAGSLSDVARSYLAGVLDLMPAMTALYCPNINSYKRAVPGAWSPVNVSWGIDNRTTAVRAIPGDTPDAARLECRLPGADANPYLVMAACLASGLYGIERGLKPSDPVEGNAYETKGLTELPSNLGAATALLNANAEAREWLTDTFVDHYVMTREYEVRRYEKAVTDWELNRYFEVT